MTQSTIEMTSIATEVGTFTARTCGSPEDPVALLLHGFPRTSHLYRHLLGPVASLGRHAVAFDQRGYSPGVRPADLDSYVMDELVADVIRVCDALDAPKVDLVGHDWGGTVAWRVGSIHPERVRTLTVLSTPHPGAFGAELSTAGSDQAQRASYMDLLRSPMAETVFLGDDAANLTSLLRGPGTDEDDVATYRSVLAEPSAFTGALNWYRADPGPGGSTRVVPVDVLHVVGADDHAFSPSAVSRSKDFVSGDYRLVSLDGAGHFLPEECPQRFLNELVEHLGRISSTS